LWTITWRLFGSNRAAAAASHAGATGSKSPEMSRTGLSDLTGLMKFRGTSPRGHPSQAFDLGPGALIAVDGPGGLSREVRLLLGSLPYIVSVIVVNNARPIR